MERISCDGCGADLSPVIDALDTQCASCGSIERTVRIEFFDQLPALRESLSFKVYEQGVRRPIREERSGDDFNRDRLRWVQLDRVIDRVNDRYWERIFDPGTGELIRLCDEPLSDHRNRGAARRYAQSRHGPGRP